MRKRIGIGIGSVAAVVLLAVALGGVVRTATAASASSAEITVVMPAGTLTATLLDFDHDGITQGDRLVSRGPLFNQGGTQRVGRVNGECVAVTARITETTGVWECSYVLELADGDVIIEGLDPRGPGSYVFGVLGGTEAYRTAAGDADLIDTADQTEIRLHLEI
jgi:hypothetical protein